MRSKRGAADLEATVAKGGESDEEDEDEDEDEEEGEGEGEDALPDAVRRRCTDVFCLLAFVLGNAALAAVASHALLHGNLMRDTSFSEGYTGDPCGFGSNWADPYLLFCLEGNGTGAGGRPALDTGHAVCVSRCPASSNESRSCGGGHVAAYPTAEFMGMMCKPRDANLTEQLRAWFQRHVEAKAVVRFHTLRGTWLLLLACALLAILVYLLYILLLAECAGCLVWSIFLLLSLGPLATGAFFLHCWHEGGCSDNSLGMEESDPRTDLAWGVLFVGVGAAFACSACNRADSIDLAVSCLEAACDCLVHVGALRLVPLVALLLRVLALAGATLVLMLLLSLGGQQDGDWRMVSLFGRLQVSHTVFDGDQWACLGVLAVMFFWDFHFVTALTDFVSIYLTELWFFRSHGGEGGMPSCALARAYWAACRYHCGTLSLGALVLGLTLPLRAVLGSVADQARTAHNPVTLLLGAVCCLCVDCHERCLAPLSKEVYMEVCLSSRPFWQASRHALKISRTEEEAVKMLNGVTLFFQVGGLLAVAVLGHTMTLLLVTNCSTFASPTSPSFVYNKQLVATAGAVVSGSAALPFMMIFDTVSDTIIFCYSVQKHRERNRLRDEAAGHYCGCLTASLPCARPRSAPGHPAPAAAAAKGAQGSPRSARQVSAPARSAVRPPGRASLRHHS